MNARGLLEALTRLGVAVAFVAIAAAASAAPTIDISIQSVGPYNNYELFDVPTTANGDGSYSVSDRGYGDNFTCDWAITVNPDPQISGSFTLNNISLATQTFILTVNLPIPVSGQLPAPTKIGGFFSEIRFDDLNGNGATLATILTNPFYRAQIDGNPLTAYGGDLGGFSVNASPGTFNTISGMDFGAPIPSGPGPALTSIMTIRHQFSLTAGDQVKFNSFFQVEAPEPTATLLVGLGLAGLVAARKLRSR